MNRSGEGARSRTSTGGKKHKNILEARLKEIEGGSKKEEKSIKEGT